MADMEKKYGRDLHAEQRATNGDSPRDFIGFFGASSSPDQVGPHAADAMTDADRAPPIGFSYRRLRENRAEDVERYGQSLLPCDCTE